MPSGRTRHRANSPSCPYSTGRVCLTNGISVLVEIKGEVDEQDRAKHQAARRWVSAVNHWGREGRWDFLVCRDPQSLGNALGALTQPLT